jgi:crotonobetainyl-CoA:carnitine CoA-transferase CaiB-like acyl-CoA transferase
MTLLLDGVRVLDFSQAIAGPLATRVLASLGADVIKVEIADGDLVRTMAAHDGWSAMFAAGNAGKRGVSLDLKSAEGLALARLLAAESDVVFENWRPGVAERLGLGYEQLSAGRGRGGAALVYCSVSGYGQDGPLRALVGADPAGQAISGMAAMTGEPGEAPFLATNGIADTSTAVNAALAIVAALYHRERTGEGQRIDIAMSDVMLFMDVTNAPLAAARRGSGPALERTGRHHPVVAPFGIFRAADGYVVIEAWGSGPDSLWGRMCRVMGREELIDDPRFVDIGERRANLASLIEVVEGWLATVPTRQEAVDRLVAAGVVAAPVLTPEEAVAHPLYLDRDMLPEVPHPVLGSVPMIRAPYRFSDACVLTSRGPALGEHNAEVLGEVLGLSSADVAGLYERGVLFHGPALDVP